MRSVYSPFVECWYTPRLLIRRNAPWLQDKVLSISREYIQNLIEYSGLHKRSIADLRQELHGMKSGKLNEWFSGLRRIMEDFHSRRLAFMVEQLRESIGPKAYCYDSPPWLGALEPFLKKSALYHEKMVVPDTLFSLVPPEGQLGDYSQEFPFWRMLTDALGYTIELEPWVEAGFVEIMIPPHYWGAIQASMDEICEEDARDEHWRNAALIDEDDEIAGEDIIRKWIKTIRMMWSGPLIKRRGGERAFAENVAFSLPSRFCGEAALAASSLGLAPVTESKHAHRLLGLWLQRRNQRLGRDVKASQGIVDLGLEEVGFIQGLPPRKILEIRDSEEISFKNFRREWAKTCSEIESMPWDATFPSEVSTLWNDRLSPSIREVKQDISYLRKKLGVGAGLVSLSIVSTVVSPSIPSVALSILSSVPALIGGTSVLDYLEKMKEIKRSSIYFFYRLGA